VPVVYLICGGTHGGVSDWIVMRLENIDDQ
jgi:hypothetical protein